jgi:hypothetical protein
MQGREHPPVVPPEVRAMIATWRLTPAFLRDRYLTVLATNAIWDALSPSFREGTNLLRATFVDGEHLHADPDPVHTSQHVTAALKRSLTRYESDQAFEEILEEVADASPLFADTWADLDDHDEEPGRFHFPHPLVGPLFLTYREITIPGRFDLTLVVWRATDPRSTDALDRLAATLP